MSWQLQEAKANFSKLVRHALEEGPQTVTRHGEEVVVVLSAREYARLRHHHLSFKEYLRMAPLEGVDLTRDDDIGRDVEL